MTKNCLCNIDMQRICIIADALAYVHQMSQDNVFEQNDQSVTPIVNKIC